MTANRNVKIGGVLLAAGGSSRMGRSKQLLRVRGETLLRRAAYALTGSVCDPAVVVLGAEIDRCREEIADLPVSICVNKDWQTGMSSSIQAGVALSLAIEPDLNGVVIMLCDQPRVSAEHIDQLIAAFDPAETDIVAAAYSGTTGVPALFSRSLFDELLKLKGDKGARDLIRGNTAARIVTIALEEAASDIDTIEDITQSC